MNVLSYIVGTIFLSLLFLPIVFAFAVVGTTVIIGLFTPKVRLSGKYVFIICSLGILIQLILFLSLGSGVAKLSSHSYVQTQDVNISGVKIKAMARGGLYYRKMFSLPFFSKFTYPPYQEIFLRIGPLAHQLTDRFPIQVDGVMYSVDNGKTFMSAPAIAVPRGHVSNQRCSFRNDSSNNKMQYFCDIPILSREFISNTPQEIILRANVIWPLSDHQESRTVEIKLESIYNTNWTWTVNSVIRDSTNYEPRQIGGMFSS